MDTSLCPNYDIYVQNYPWIKDTPETRAVTMGPNGVHSKGVPLYTYY